VSTPPLSDLDHLLGLTRYAGIDSRPTLLRVLTDLYVQKPMHSAEEEQHYTELALRLIEVVDIPTRKTIADRLVRYPAAPLAVIRRLARDFVAFAKTDIQQLLDSPDVINQAKSITPSMTSETAIIHPPTAPVESLGLGERFYAADSAGRQTILASVAAMGPAARQSLPSILDEDTINHLENAVLGSRPDIFIHELEYLLDLSRANVQKIVNDTSGEPMVIAGIALGMPLAILQRILLFLNPAVGRSVERIYALTALYQATKPEVALRLVAIWRNTKTPARATGHQPFLWDDERRGTRDSATAAPHRSPAQVQNDRRPLDARSTGGD
jgi:hypothetical protein